MIDGHCHLDGKIGDCAEAMHTLHEEAVSAGMKNVVLLNIPELGFENREVIDRAKGYDGFFYSFPSVNPFAASVDEEMKELKTSGATGLKLHPRLHGYHIENKRCFDVLQAAGELNFPVLIDCFPDGKNLSLKNMPESFAHLAEKVPDVRIAIGHAGGHRVLDALMIAKYYKNIFLDLSYTLLYYRNSGVMKNIAYAIESLRAERIFWGSDYPDRPYRETLQLSLEEFRNMRLSPDDMGKLTEQNIKNFLGVC